MENIIQHLKTGNSVLLLGKGNKRKLLQAVGVALPKSIYFDELRSPKMQLVKIAKQLHRSEWLKTYVSYPDWRDVERELRRMDEDDLMEFLLPSLKGCTLIFDNIDTATSRAIRKLIPLFDAGVTMLLAAEVARQKIDVIRTECVVITV